MAARLMVLNGPNLNRLGMREPEIYGRTTLAEIELLCREAGGDRQLVFRQSNFEGEIVGWIHEAIDAQAGILINPAGLSFTSVPILDALKIYGMFNADNGTAGYISGATDTGWNDEDLAQLKTVPITAFEAIEHGPVVTTSS